MINHQTANPEGSAAAAAPVIAAAPTVRPLTDGDRAEALDFLSAASVDAIYMRGLVLDNGLDSPANRGTFYGARDAAGRLEGVALVGHATLVEARTEGALAAFARLAQGLPDVHLLVGTPAGAGSSRASSAASCCSSSARPSPSTSPSPACAARRRPTSIWSRPSTP
jgi:hypothetical protein